MTNFQNEEGPDKFVFNAYNFTNNRTLGKMMFNTDFEMFYDLQLNNATSETECNLNPLCGQDGSCSDDECPVAPVYAQSASYAQVNFFTSICFSCTHWDSSNQTNCDHLKNTQITAT